MKKIIALVLSLFVAQTAFADTCAKNLTNVFTSNQAVKLCATFTGSSTISASLIPGTDNTYDIGDTTHTLRTLYTGTSIIAKTSEILRVRQDAQRLFTFDGSSDTALTLTFGDGGATAVQQLVISASTADGDDDSTVILAGGGADGGTRGASITLPGEEVAGGSDITYNAGTGDTHIFNVAGSLAATISATTLVGVGEITSSSTGSLGWSYVTGANTACTTTCTSAAVFGVDLAAGASQPVIVAAASATADACVCAGAS